MYTLEGKNPKIKVLHHNGYITSCPYTAAQMQVPCCTTCPQFEVNTKSNALGNTEKATTVTLHCTGRQITIGETA